MSVTEPVRFGLTGLGGYAGVILEEILAEQIRTDAAAKLVAVFDPYAVRFPEKLQQLRQLNVAVCDSYASLLDAGIDAVWLPLPIDLHLPYTRQALACGKGVICEKPAAACVDDVDAMITARDHAKLPVMVGFQDISQPAIIEAKQRLVSGALGRILSIRVTGCWPRSHRYYTRTDWAGRMQREGAWILDSPAANALAHYLHLGLFFAGSAVDEAATPMEVCAELYRANDIENYDTCSYQVRLPGETLLHASFTHASTEYLHPVVTVLAERGSVRCGFERPVIIRTGDHIEELAMAAKPWSLMMGVFRKWMFEGTHAAVGATLEMARMHTMTFAGASEASPVYEVPPSAIETVTARDQTPLRAIRNIVPAISATGERGCMLHETGMLPWTRRGRSIRPGSAGQAVRLVASVRRHREQSKELAAGA